MRSVVDGVCGRWCRRRRSRTVATHTHTLRICGPRIQRPGGGRGRWCRRRRRRTVAAHTHTASLLILLPCYPSENPKLLRRCRVRRWTWSTRLVRAWRLLWRPLPRCALNLWTHLRMECPAELRIQRPGGGRGGVDRRRAVRIAGSFYRDDVEDGRCTHTHAALRWSIRSESPAKPCEDGWGVGGFPFPRREDLPKPWRAEGKDFGAEGHEGPERSGERGNRRSPGNQAMFANTVFGGRFLLAGAAAIAAAGCQQPEGRAMEGTKPRAGGDLPGGRRQGLCPCPERIARKKSCCRSHGGRRQAACGSSECVQLRVDPGVFVSGDRSWWSTSE